MEEIKYKNYFLSDKNCYHRLLEDYKKHGKIIVAYDFDNTVFDYHGKGYDFSEIINLVRECNYVGFELICYTAEQDLEKVKNYLNKNQIPFDKINEQPDFYKERTGKLYYNIMLDDRAGLRSAFEILEKLVKYIKNK